MEVLKSFVISKRNCVWIFSVPSKIFVLGFVFCYVLFCSGEWIVDWSRLNSYIKCRLDFSRSEISVIHDEENQDYEFEVWYKMNNLYYIIKFHAVHLKFGTAFFSLLLFTKYLWSSSNMNAHQAISARPMTYMLLSSSHPNFLTLLCE
jgi:hypothetical protein